MSTPSHPRRVVLVNTNRMRPAVAPLAIEYLADALERSGFVPEVLDLCFAEDPHRAIDASMAGGEPLAIGVTLRNTDDVAFASQDFFVPRLKEITDYLKAKTSAPVVLGGSGFSVMPEPILRYCGLDLGVWGEGEESLPLLLSRLATGEDWRDVPGLVYRAGGGFVRNPAVYSDLRSRNPHRGAIDNARYFAEGGMAGVETKRGCPMGCIYCADPLAKGRRVRLRSPESVAAEMESLLELGVDHFHLCDCEFNIPYAHARDVCEALIRRGLGERARWYTYASPIPFDRELAALCRRAGCAGINFGVDAACDAMLKTLGRDHRVSDLEQTAEACRQEGIVVMYDLLLGGPGETRETLRETVEGMKRISPDRVGASMGIRLFPGTALADLVHSEGHPARNPSLRGATTNNEGFFLPVFYLSAALGKDAPAYLAELIGRDQRFFLFESGGTDQNYNYNENNVLVQAIKRGYRGAFWDILRRLAEE